jgi:hypothetical protein
MADLEGLTPDFQARLNAMIGASNGKITITSGYRSYDKQKAMFEQAVKDHGSEAAAQRYVAKPGESNHNKGIAADLGGDIELAHKLAPQFGLHFPMDWEPWHVQPLGAVSSKDAYTTPPDGADTKTANPMGRIMNEVSTLLNGGNQQGQSDSSDLQQLDAAIASSSSGDVPTGTPSTAAAAGAAGGLDAFMAAIGGQESGGNYSSTNSSSGAHGKFQIMPGNWGPWAKEAGLGAGAPQTPDNQEKVARYKMQQYYDQFQDWGKVAKAWYSGPGNVNKNVGGGSGYPDSDSYAKQVVARMGS